MGINMERFIDPLLNWAQNSRRKPLILRGAGQVGKTYAIKILAKTRFQNDFVLIDDVR